MVRKTAASELLALAEELFWTHWASGPDDDDEEVVEEEDAAFESVRAFFLTTGRGDVVVSLSLSVSWLLSSSCCCRAFRCCCIAVAAACCSLRLFLSVGRMGLEVVVLRAEGIVVVDDDEEGRL